MAAPALGSHRLTTRWGVLDLGPDGTAFEPVSQTLLVADVLVGKAEVFRRLGVPVPAQTSLETLELLTQSIEQSCARRVIVLGDLIHGRLPADHPVFDALSRWRVRHAQADVQLVRGNHDRGAGDLPAYCGINIWPDGKHLGQFKLCQEPGEAELDTLVVCGHVHPVVRLRSRLDSLRMRCFWVQPKQIVLPAFGAFTGGFAVKPALDDQLFVLDGQTVLKLPPAPLGQLGQLNRPMNSQTMPVFPSGPASS